MRRLAILLTLCLGLLAAPALAFFSLSGFQNSMIEFLIDQLSTEGELEITVEEVVEPEDGVTAIRGLSVSDADGVWFTAETLDFAWNPSRLLQGEVEFSRLSMAGVHVLRQPIIPESAPEDAEPADPGAPAIPKIAWPRSPLTLRVDNLTLEGVRIDEPVLGHAIAFDATGAARDEGDIQSARLELARTDTIAGTIAFDYARDFAANTLAVNLSAAEAPGGLVASLGDLPRDAPSEVTLTAEGPPTDWRMRFDLAIAELISADGTAAISYQGPLKVDADLSARAGPKLSPEIAALLGPGARIRARATEGQDGTILIEEGRVTSPDLSMAASGSFARPTSTADLEVELDAGPRLADPFEGVTFGGLTFVGTIKGAPGSLVADGDLVLDGLSTEPADVRRAELTVDVRQSGPAEAMVTELVVAGLTRGLRLDRLSAALIGDAETEIEATLAGNTLDLETLWLDSDLLRVSASGTADLETMNAALGLGISTPDLRPVAAAYGAEAAGQIEIIGELDHQDGISSIQFETGVNGFEHPMAAARTLGLRGTVLRDSQSVGFTASGSGTDMRLDRIGSDLLSRADIAAEGTLADGLLELARLDLVSPLVDAALSGQIGLEQQTVRVDYDVRTPDLGRVAALYDVPAAGRLSAQGEATRSGPEAAPRLKGTLAVADAVWDARRYGRVALTHDVEASASPWGNIALSNDGGPFGPVHVKTDFALAEPRLMLKDLSARALGLAADGNLSVDLDGPLAEGKLALAISDLAGLRPLTGTALGGSARGALQLTTSKGRQNASLDLTARNIEADGTRIATARIVSTLANLLGKPSIDLSVTAEDLTNADNRLDTLSLDAKGPLSGLAIGASLRGSAGRQPLTASLAGRVNASAPTIRANVSRLDAALGDDRIGLNRSLSVTARGSTVALNGMDLSLPGGGQLLGNVTSHGGPLSGDVRLMAPDLSVLKRLADIPFNAGSLSAEATFDTRRRASRANVTLTGRAIAFDGVEAAGALSIDGTLAWQGRSAAINAEIGGVFGDPVRLKASVPVVASGTVPQLAQRGPVEGSVRWTGEIGDLWALVPAPGHVVTGKADIDLGVSGDISDPAIAGGANISEGGYQNVDAGTILTDLALETTLTPSGDLGLSLTASDGAQGVVETTGTVALDASGMDIRTVIRNAVLVRRDDVTARMDGDLSVKGPADGLAIGGKITVTDAEVRLINANPPSVVTLGEVLIKGEPEPEKAVRSSSTTLALDIDAPGRIFVRGRGLDSEWKMALRLRGNAAAPDLTGRIERVRGRLSLIGKGFDLTRGRIDFDGGPEIDPRLDIVLERETSDLTGRIVVSGTGSDPSLGFSSTPALPEDEVLPRTLFGKSSQALTGSQAIQLGLGLATLMDGGGGTLDSVRGAVGLDSLRVEQDSSGNAAVAAGKEVSEGVWVGTQQPLGGEGGTSVVVEIDVFEDIQIDAEVEPGGGSSVGVQWKQDF